MYNPKLYFVIITCIFASYVAAQSLEELQNEYVEMIVGCLKEYPVTAEDMVKLKMKQMPDNESAKCLLACTYKKAGMMDEKGFLSIEGVNKISQTYLSDPEKIKKSEEFTEACKTVNDVPVNDGDKGCERAALIYKCSIEKSAQFDFI